MLGWICSQIGSWIRRWTEFDAKMFPSSKNPKIFVFVAISSVTWMDSHLGIETTGRLVEICEIGEITGKSSEIRARGSPRWAAVHFILRCIEPSRVQRVEKVTRNQGGAGNHFFSNSFRTMFRWLRWKKKKIQAAQIDVIPQINACLNVLKPYWQQSNFLRPRIQMFFPFLAFPCKTQ